MKRIEQRSHDERTLHNSRTTAVCCPYRVPRNPEKSFGRRLATASNADRNILACQRGGLRLTTENLKIGRKSLCTSGQKVAFPSHVPFATSFSSFSSFTLTFLLQAVSYSLLFSLLLILLLSFFLSLSISLQLPVIRLSYSHARLSQTYTYFLSFFPSTFAFTSLPRTFPFYFFPHSSFLSSLFLFFFFLFLFHLPSPCLPPSSYRYRSSLSTIVSPFSFSFPISLPPSTLISSSFHHRTTIRLFLTLPPPNKT